MAEAQRWRVDIAAKTLPVVPPPVSGERMNDVECVGSSRDVTHGRTAEYSDQTVGWLAYCCREQNSGRVRPQIFSPHCLDVSARPRRRPPAPMRTRTLRSSGIGRGAMWQLKAPARISSMRRCVAMSI